MSDVDINALEALLAAMTPGPYEGSPGHLISRDPRELARQLAENRKSNEGGYQPRNAEESDVEFLRYYRAGALIAESLGAKNSAAIAALLNAAPELIGACRAANQLAALLKENIEDSDKLRAGLEAETFRLNDQIRDKHRILDEYQRKVQRLERELGAALNRLQSENGAGFRRGMLRAAELVQKHAPADARIVHDETETDRGPIEALHSLIADAANDMSPDNGDCPNLPGALDGADRDELAHLRRFWLLVQAQTDPFVIVCAIRVEQQRQRQRRASGISAQPEILKEPS